MNERTRSRPLCSAGRAALAALLVAASTLGADEGVPILVYHRFGPVAADSMTVRTPVFEEQLRTLDALGRVVIPLRRLVEARLGRAPAPPPGAVVISADDGHRSVHSVMLPIIRARRIPVTLFVYPSAISRAKYAMTWAELRELVETGLFDVQSHSYWHPRFSDEKRRRAPADYERFVADQLTRSRRVLEHELGRPVDLLAWPFGIHDAELERLAAEAGYVAAFTIEGRPTRPADAILALPRHLVSDAHRGSRFEALLVAPGGTTSRNGHHEIRE